LAKFAGFATLRSHGRSLGRQSYRFKERTCSSLKPPVANMDRTTFDTLARLLRIMTYMFEDGDQPEDKDVLQDIAHVRAWMAKIEKDVD
jgi:hypothetical protein